MTEKVFQEAGRTAWGRRLSPFGVPLLVATGIALGMGGYRHTLTMLLAGTLTKPRPVLVSLAVALSFYWGFALVTPSIRAVMRRFSPEETSWFRWASVAVLLGLGLAPIVLALQMLLFMALEWLFGTTSGGGVRDSLAIIPGRLPGAAVSNPLIVWVIAGLSTLGERHRRYSAERARAVQLRSQMDRARVRLLRSQLDPHFLFNALNGVVTLIHRDPSTARVMVERLAELFRASWSRGQESEITLAEELQLLRSYLAIEGMRYGDRLHVEFGIDPMTLEALVPTLILQPLAENAVRHGIAPKPDGGMIRIITARSGSSLRVEIHDTGVGLSGRRPVRPGNGLGMRLTRQRLEHHFGSGFLFTTLQPPSGGTEVALTFPLRAAPAKPMDTAREVEP